MTNFVPEKQDREKNSDKIGEKLYKGNWEAILNGLKQIDENLAEFVKEIPYGTLYPRKELSLDFREVAAITCLTQLNLKPQLKTHIIAALNIGLSKVQIIELFLHISQFIGLPLVLDGMKVAKEVFDHYRL